MAVIDALSWFLPAVAAVSSVGAGIAALSHADACAALLGIGGGAIGFVGVVFANWASRIRDGRLAIAHAVASLGLDVAAHTQSRLPSGI